jgi:histidyl-tRNA synthetase
MKPSLPQGTRDFGPDVVRKRQYILNTIKSVFDLYGYQPLETPALENLETLLGKYGDEGDQLIFKILNNGLDHPSKQDAARSEFENVLQGKSSKVITERALKYDLTIPFARYVAMNYGQLYFPFKRYQIQPVWRADRPQKGRYREFYQCDADVIGSKSLWNEAELAQIYHDVFTKLKLDTYRLSINSRKILSGLAEISGGLNKMTDITITIDKLDKIGIEKVKEDLEYKGLTKGEINVIEHYLNISGSNEEKLSELKKILETSETGSEGIKELEFLISLVTEHDPTMKLHVDFTLARGLNYYTGIIFEAKAPQEVKIGSIGGGGRYDDLTGLFGVPNVPGVGISFGVDRIYDVLEELNLFPENLITGSKVLFFNLGDEEGKIAFQLLQQLRSRGISSELYPETVKMEKQFKYAEKKRIPYVVIIGSREMETGQCVLKNIETGKQQTMIAYDLLEHMMEL